PAGKGRDGQADVGLCLLDLFSPGVREGKENIKEEVSRQPYTRENQHLKPKHSNQDGGPQGGETHQQQSKQLKVGIGGVFNRNTITHYSWWESSVFYNSNVKMVDWGG
ncbi:hypothetical protein FRX31_011428, partial [Thalictrum thalictroides]